MQNAMDSCPPEIWMDIFALVCDDGGRAGCTLSAVSRRFRELVDPVRLHTVSVSGLAQLQAAAKFVAARPPDLRSIHHLYITGAPDGRPTHGQSALSSAYRAAHDALLSLAAPHLRTLVLAPTHGLITFESLALPGVTFPLLTALAAEIAPPKAAPCDVDLHLPALRRLHLHGMDSFPHPQLLAVLSARAPALTHLRLDAHCVAALPAVLARALGRTGLRCLARPDSQADASIPVLLPARLREIAVRPVVVDFRNRYLVYMDGSRHWIMKQGLHELSATAVVGDPAAPAVVVLEQGVHEEADFFADWESLVAGGHGCFDPQRRVVSRATMKASTS